MTHALTHRQQNEAEVYDARASTLGAQWSDDDLRVSSTVPPYPNREHIVFLDLLLDAVGDLAAKKIIEVGSGSGTLTTYLALKGARPLGVDVSAGMLQLAARRADVNGVGDVAEFRASAIETLDDPDGSFDAVIANQVLHHLELEDAMENIARLLRPGGVALFAEPVFFLPSWVRAARYTRPALKVFPSAADTPDEAPLNRRDIELICSHFDRVELRQHQLTTRLQNFHHLGDTSFRRLERFDRWALTIPGAKSAARYVTLVLYKDLERAEIES